MKSPPTEKDCLSSEAPKTQPNQNRVWIRYGVMSVGWTVLVCTAWTAYFMSLPSHEERAYTQWVEALNAFEKLSPSKNRPTPAAKPITAERLKVHVEHLSIERSTIEGRSRARSYIGDVLTAQGWLVQSHAFPQGTNLWVEKPGKDKQMGLLVIAAHYDGPARSPGADDNASGVAVVLELARIARKWNYPMGVRFIFFDCEEKGLLGARAYLADPKLRVGIRSAIILEMLGYKCAEKGCQKSLPGLPSFESRTKGAEIGDFLAAVGNMEPNTPLSAVKRAQRAEGPPILAIPIPKDYRLALDQSRRSDHAAFWDVDIPAVMLTDTANFRNPHYHKQTDTPDTLDYGFLTGNAMTVRDAVHILLVEYSKIPKNVTAEKEKR